MRHTPQQLIEQAERRVADGDRAAALELLEQALVRGADQLWVHRNAAAVWQTGLGDRARAATVLGAYERQLGDATAAGYEWRLLAEGWLEILGDRDAALRCLTAGQQRARTADDLCSIAKGLVAQFGDADTARDLLATAEQRARQPAEDRDRTHTARAWWTIANGWKELFDDRERAQRCFAEGLERAADASACAMLARGVASHDLGAARIRACLQRGRELATVFEERFDLADAGNELLREPELVRDLLADAEPLATESGQRQRLARAWRDWLGDTARAERVGSVGVLPAQWLGSPAAAELFDWLRAHVRDDALIEVADADYGHAHERHLHVLRDIVASGLVPTPVPWHPVEVCGLYHWRESDDCDHTARALCCVLLVYHDASGFGGGVDATWAVLLDSCVALGPDALRMVVGLADAIAAHPRGVGDDCAVARLAAFLARTLRAADEAEIAAAADRFLTACANQEPEDRLPARLAGDLCAHVWSSLFARALARLPGAADTEPLAVVRAALAGFTPD